MRGRTSREDHYQGLVVELVAERKKRMEVMIVVTKQNVMTIAPNVDFHRSLLRTRRAELSLDVTCLEEPVMANLDSNASSARSELAAPLGILRLCRPRKTCSRVAEKQALLVFCIRQAVCGGEPE